MADIKITALPALAVQPAALDVIAIVDVSDNGVTASGTTKHITIADLAFLSNGANISLLNNDSGYITSAPFNDGGEAGGADRDLGNTDAFGLSFITSGVGRINILATGEVGIGTSTPTEKLEVVGKVKISDDLSVNTNLLFADISLSRVGIGTATPIATLDVQGSFNAAGVNHTTSATSLGVGWSYTGNATGNNFEIINTNAAAFTTLLSLKRSASQRFQFVASATESTFLIKSSAGVNEHGFATNGTSFVNRNGGNFGIGTSTPTEKLDVVGNALVNGKITSLVNLTTATGVTVRNTNATSTAYSTVSFGNNTGIDKGLILLNSSTNTFYGGVNSLNIGTTTTANLSLFTNALTHSIVMSGTNGSLGIGSLSANGAKLSLGAQVGERLHLYDAVAPYGFGIQANLMQSFVPAAGSHAWGFGTSAAFTEWGRINSGGMDVSGVYKVGGVSGVTQTGAYTNFTIVGGIITAAS